MTDARCEPPEGRREKVGHHALERMNDPYSVHAWWNPQFEGWKIQGFRGVKGWTSPREAWLQGFRYLCPIPTSETLTAMVAALEACANLQEDVHGVQLLAVAALHKYDPSRCKIPNIPPPKIDPPEYPGRPEAFGGSGDDRLP